MTRFITTIKSCLSIMWNMQPSSHATCVWPQPCDLHLSTPTTDRNTGMLQTSQFWSSTIANKIEQSWKVGKKPSSMCRRGGNASGPPCGTPKTDNVVRTARLCKCTYKSNLTLSVIRRSPGPWVSSLHTSAWMFDLACKVTAPDASR